MKEFSPWRILGRERGQPGEIECECECEWMSESLAQEEGRQRVRNRPPEDSMPLDPDLLLVRMNYLFHGGFHGGLHGGLHGGFHGGLHCIGLSGAGPNRPGVVCCDTPRRAEGVMGRRRSALSDTDVSIPRNQDGWDCSRLETRECMVWFRLVCVWYSFGIRLVCVSFGLVWYAFGLVCVSFELLIGG